MKDLPFSYDTVTLRPRYSTLKSRVLADTSLVFLGNKFRLPVVPANMKDVISPELAWWLSSNEYFYIMHRFDGITPDFIKFANVNNFKIISVSIGCSIRDEQPKYSFEQELSVAIKENYRIDYITIDVAHAHHENIQLAIDYIRTNFPKTKLIVGNVATGSGIDYLMKLGVDAIKVGIGGGGICTTRYKTGFHLPTLQSVSEAEDIFKILGNDVPIIADGGAKHYGDIAKALTFGASMIMSGGWFASCIDSPAKIENGKKIYRGSTSYAAKGENRHIEGITLELDSGTTYQERLIEIQQSLQSSISYAGGSDLSSFNHVKWERILPYH